VLRRQVGEHDPALPAREPSLVEMRAVRLDEELFREGDPNVQRASFPPF
jgi:hypothetical protein